MKKRKFVISFLVILYNFNPLPAQEKISATGPPYQNPEIRQDTEGNAPTPALPLAASGKWWEVLGYQKLNNLVELALSDNNELDIAESYVDESRARVKLARSSLFPSLHFAPSFFRQEYSINRPMAQESAEGRIRSNTYSLPLDLAYEVDIFGKTKDQVQASEFNLRAASALQQASKLDIASAVARNFVVLVTLDVEERILERTLNARKENLAIIHTRYQAGLANEIDLQRAKTELSSVSVQLKNLQIERREVEVALATLCGQPASSFSIDKLNVTSSVPLINVPDTLSLALRRPDLLAADYSVEAYRKQLGNARKDRYPSLYITGSTGLLAGSHSHLLENDSRNWLVGATLSVPLFEGGKRNAQLAISDHQLQGSISRLNQEKLIAIQEVEREKSTLLRLREQREAQQEFVEAAQRAAGLSHQRYRNGLVTYLEVVDAERIVLEAERLSAQLLGKQLLSTVDLIVAMGGNI